jgi:predicted dehydrogenase
MIRGAISGFGEVAARAHLPGWHTRAKINVSVIHDTVPERRHEALQLVKGVRVYDDLELMLDGESLDFVDIASPPALHARSAASALEANASVLVEKPLALSLADFDRIARIADEKGRVMMCVHNWKYAPPYVTARDLVASGRLGSVSSIAMDRLRTQPAGKGGAGGRWRQTATSGGGILIDHGWHIFYLMQWLLGGAAPESVAARLDFPTGSDADDTAELRIMMTGGCIATSHLSWRSTERRTSARVEGDRGRLDIEGDRVTLTDREGKVEDLSVADAPDDSYHAAWFAGMAQEFEAALTGGPDSEPAHRNRIEARNCIAVIAAARASAANDGESIRLRKSGLIE